VGDADGFGAHDAPGAPVRAGVVVSWLYRKENGERQIVLCGRGVHLFQYQCPMSHNARPDYQPEQTDEPCDRCVREGRQIAEVQS
jgi:hypothetical protein